MVAVKFGDGYREYFARELLRQALRSSLSLACLSRPLDRTRRIESPMSEEPLIAVFVDFENLAIGVRDMKVGKFQIQLVLKRLLEKGRLVYKRAYSDWSNYQDAVKEFHSHGIELIDIPQTKVSGKNSADQAGYTLGIYR